MKWAQVCSGLLYHKKTSHLAEELELTSAAVDPNVIAAGMLVGLWTWAIENAYNGDLSDCSARMIASACHWKGDPERLVQALKKAGFLDEDMKLHDWKQYAVQIMDDEEERKRKGRERVRRCRERKKLAAQFRTACAPAAPTAPAETRCNADVTLQQNDPFPPYAPLMGFSPLQPPISFYPPLIPPNQENSGAASAGARARENLSAYCDERGLKPAQFFGMTPEVAEEVAAITDAAFAQFANRPVTELDRVNVFHCLRRSREDTETGTWTMTLPKDRQDLLFYAFEAAANAGRAGNWQYINGVLRRLHQRGIRTLVDAEDYEYRRDWEGVNAG